MQLNSDLSTVKGRVFYKVVVLLSNNSDEDRENALSEIANSAQKKFLTKQKDKMRTEKTLNKYQEFIAQFVSSQAEVSEKVSIENTRFTKVLNLTADDFYAYEVFSIAKSQGIKPKNAFEQLTPPRKKQKINGIIRNSLLKRW